MSKTVHRLPAAALMTAGIVMAALMAPAAQAQTAAPAPAATPTTSTTATTTTTVHHYHHRSHASGDSLTAQLNHQELMRVTNAGDSTATITNVTSYNYGHQVLPTGAPTATDLAIYPNP